MLSAIYCNINLFKGAAVGKQRHRSVVYSVAMYSPCLLVAELLRDHFPQFQPQPIGHLLGQVVVGAPAKKHDVRHVRQSDAARSREAKEKACLRIGFPTGGLWNGEKVAG